ncbi:MAG TPA: protein TolR [Alcanivoracaceae bacterium]|nr:protein TolR [Alcanivoracaceae bacterium]
MVKIRRRKKLMADINVVPYIDVMLVLLVVFMITAPMMTQGIHVDLPQANSEPIDDQEPVVITVKRDGAYYLNVGEGQEEATTTEALQENVQRIMKHAPDTLFLVEGDGQVPYGRVVTLMGELQTIGVTKLGLVTEPVEKGR